MTASEMDEVLSQEIEAAHARMEAYDERAAIQDAEREARMRGKNTSNFAIFALQQSDTAWGSHAVARSWIRNYDPGIRVFARLA